MNDEKRTIPFPTAAQSQPSNPEPVESHYWDPDEIQAAIRDAYSRGIDPATLFQRNVEEVRPAA